MGARIVGGTPASSGARSVPTTGMRGGLGRTLLTAFLILTILPLAVTGGYAVQQNRSNLEREVAAKLLAIAVLKGEALLRWFEELFSSLSSSLSAHASGSPYEDWWSVYRHQVRDAVGVMVLEDGEPAWSAGECLSDEQALWAVGDIWDGENSGRGAGQQATGILVRPAASVGGPSMRSGLVALSDAHVVVGFAAPEADRTVLLCLEPETIIAMLRTDAEIGRTGRISLCVPRQTVREQVYREGLSVVSEPAGAGVDMVLWPGGEPCVMPAPANGVDTFAPTHQLYKGLDGGWTMGAFYPLPWFDRGAGVVIVVEHVFVEVLASTENMMATLIALVLAVALATTAIAAVVIRQITRPVIDLTESAIAMAEGKLDQRLAVRSRDEIGILTYVFNEMAAELKSLYDDLEAKVVERTQRLQQANYQIQRRALHLQASQKVGQAITSVRDPELLLTQVTDLIRDHFVYSSVAVYMVAPGGGEARLQACSPSRPLVGNEDGQPALGLLTSGGERPWPLTLRIRDGSLVGRALREGDVQVHSEPALQTEDRQQDWNVRMLSEVAVPLKMEARVVGAIGVVTMAHEGIQQDELDVLEVLANQVTVALENARAYERERLAIQRMEAADAFKVRFLANMSHALRGPLNTIIGFSRLLLKGIEGPISQRQREDLEQIHGDSQHLLSLINDILSISQIQAGLTELRLEPVDLAQLVETVMPTATALVRGKPIVLTHDIPETLPRLYADPARLRHVLVHLLNNAAKFTQQGTIAVRAWASDGEVYVSVSDSGVGIPEGDRERIFAYFERRDTRAERDQLSGGIRTQAATTDVKDERSEGVGIGLALCKEFIELHGGRIWVDSEPGIGSTFTFSIGATL